MAEDTHASSGRVVGVDVYRGFVMFLMMAEVLRLSRMHQAFPDSSIWEFLAYHQSHVPWVGCSLHDLIQPSFSFLVGVAMPFSLAKRLSQGDSTAALARHAIWRAVLLVMLGIFLRSTHREQTYFTFEDTLSQIGLGYFPLFLLGLAQSRIRWIVLCVLVVGYWAAFVAYPLPGPDFDYAAVGVPQDWPHHATGIAAHWNKNSNLAWAFDTWFLNLFPRESLFTHNGGGYATLSFIPTLATMLLGLIAGNWMLQNASKRKVLSYQIVAGLVCLVAGIAADRLGICPNVKRIWTPSWVLFSGGWCFLFLAAFYGICDLWRLQSWAYPLRVIGANSITAYCIAHLIHEFVVSSFEIHLGKHLFEFWGVEYAPFFEGIAVLSVFWGILHWMYRQKIFVRI
ncbi:MAG: DUF5009 domain-containing protein [Planctomycetales bacterium]|nr:DUF5009 domain-containing protein [Planctomycetales bacterium]